MPGNRRHTGGNVSQPGWQCSAGVDPRLRLIYFVKCIVTSSLQRPVLPPPPPPTCPPRSHAGQTSNGVLGSVDRLLNERSLSGIFGYSWNAGWRGYFRWTDGQLTWRILEFWCPIGDHGTWTAEKRSKTFWRRNFILFWDILVVSIRSV